VGKERYWVEAQFVELGDSGSLIIISEGKGVAMVVRADEITQIRLVTVEEGIADMQYM
jgi:hypothetical protein